MQSYSDPDFLDSLQNFILNFIGGPKISARIDVHHIDVHQKI